MAIWPGALTIPVVQANSTNTVDHVKPELSDILPTYILIYDCLLGSRAIKAKGETYLPMPNPADKSEGNRLRYADYIKRAVFYGVTKRTLSGMSGQVFLLDPIITVPPLLIPVERDANGEGTPLIQLAQLTEEFVISFGRAGILIDYPKTQGATTVADQKEGRIRPTISTYSPFNIINWRTAKVGGETVLTLVVLRETYAKQEKEFETEYDIQFRVLRLVDGRYHQEIWQGDEGKYEKKETIIPLQGNGLPLNEIPFKFIGAVDNTPSIDPPPLGDMAELNIAHYRNSADYEDSVFMIGQPTPVIAGLTQQWVEQVLGGRIDLGSRAAVMLPENSSASLLQPEPNSMVKEAMEQKERQMVALGAKLVEQKTVQRTATEAGIEEASETSTLTTITNNVSSAFRWALEWCDIFVGGRTVISDANDESIKFELNTEFDLSGKSPDEVRSTIDAWMKDAITFSEMRNELRKTGMATLDDDAAKKELRDDQMEQIGLNAELGLDPAGQVIQDNNNPPNDE